MIYSLKRLESGLIVTFNEPLYTISSAIHNGGIGFRDGFFVIYVDKNYSANAYEDLRSFAMHHALENHVGFMTAAWNLYYHKEGIVKVYANIGLDNLCVPGEDCLKNKTVGTVNIYVLIDHPLSTVGLINALCTAMEAKAYALTKLTGAPSTTSDACMVSSIKGEEDFAGSATDVGRNIGVAVRKIIEEGVRSYLLKDRLSDA